MHAIAESATTGALYALIACLCLGGLVLAMLSISGTWAVLLAALCARLLPGGTPIGWGLILGFAVVAAAVEVVEWVAGAWGVQRRGGSRAAGLAAVVGGLAGLVLGSFIPVPIVGSLIGMTLGSFALVYAVERRRLKHAGQAAYIAWGAVVSRVAVLVLKLVVTLGMVAWLTAELVRGW